MTRQPECRSVGSFAAGFSLGVVLMFYFIRGKLINTEGDPVPLVIAALLVIAAWLLGPYLRGDMNTGEGSAEAKAAADSK